MTCSKSLLLCNLVALVVSYAISTTASGTTGLLRGGRDDFVVDKEDSGNEVTNNVAVHKKRSHAKNNIFDNNNNNNNHAPRDDNPSPPSKLPSSAAVSTSTVIVRAKQTRIIGGTTVADSTSSNYRYIASIQDAYSHYCAGTLIAPDVVLTAAHCLGGSYEVIIGRSMDSFSSSSSSTSKAKLREMKHPQYDESNSNNDYGLIFLTTEVTVTATNGDDAVQQQQQQQQQQQIVTLNQDDAYPPVGSTVTALGWGDTNPTDEILMASSSLRRVDLNIISNVDCEDSTDGGGIDYEGQITNNMICAHDVKGGGRDACQVREMINHHRRQTRSTL